MNKGKYIFVGGNPVGYGLAERAGFLKKGYRQTTVRARRFVKTKQITFVWSSSEYNSNNAGNVNFNSSNVNLNYNNKNNNNYVRSVLAFSKTPINNRNK